MESLNSNFGLLLQVCILFASNLYSAAAMDCDDSDCSGDCCFDGGYYCCYSVAYAWWFWFIWGIIFLIILFTCCAIARRRQLRRRQVIVVQQGYTTPTAYGTLINTETPPTVYNQYGGYPQPPPGPAPPYQSVVAAGGMPPAQQFQPAQAVPSKPAEYNPSDKPPPYNPMS